MKKQFVCLAKSKKYNGRCVAGILVSRKKSDNSLQIERDESGNPLWIRPISPSLYGSIDEKVGKQLELLTIYEIDRVVPCPDDYQSENSNYQHPHYQFVTKINKNKNNLDACCDQQKDDTLFGNRGRVISENSIQDVTRSIRLIKVENCSVYVKEREDKADQYRITFRYKDYVYDLPLTDLDFIDAYKANAAICDDCELSYLTLSIGRKYEGWYYKLVAAVFLI